MSYLNNDWIATDFISCLGHRRCQHKVWAPHQVKGPWEDRVRHITKWRHDQLRAPLVPLMTCDSGCERFKHFFHFHSNHDVELCHRECWKNTAGGRGSPAPSGCCMASVVGSGVARDALPQPGAQTVWSLSTFTALSWPRDRLPVALLTQILHIPGLLPHQHPLSLYMCMYPATSGTPIYVPEVAQPPETRSGQINQCISLPSSGLQPYLFQ